MGLMYLKGWGVPQNYDTAMEWYRRAAEQGSEVARRRMNSIQLLKINKGKITSIERGTGFPVPGTIFADTLSVRQSPNTSSKRLKTLKTGHPVSVSRAVDSDNDYWFYVKTASGTEGWVLGGYVKLVDRDLSYEEINNRKNSLPKTGNVVTRDDKLNLRNIPSINGSVVVEKLDGGTAFTAYEIFAVDTMDWYRISTTEGKEGWLSGKYIQLASSVRTSTPTPVNSYSYPQQDKQEVITIEQLAEECKTNSARLGYNLGGKRVNIRGRVETVDPRRYSFKTGQLLPCVEFWSGVFVNCFFSENVSSIYELSAGDYTTIQGTLYVYDDHVIELFNCKIVGN